MFNNPGKPDSSVEEGTVIEVDVERRMCKVKTLSGQNLTGVQWIQSYGGSSRGGDRGNPLLGDRVLVDSRLGFPLLLGCLPKAQSTENVFPLDIDQGDNIVDTGNFSGAGTNVVPDQNAPGDMLSGDRVFGSPGGGMISLLRAGSVLLRSSRLSEIYLSKWDDMVRIVSRNWNHFTDASSDVVRNINGRVFRYIGYAPTFKDAKIENYMYNQYIGDTVLAETVKTDQETPDSLPAATDVVFKEQITSGSGGSSSESYSREIHLDGTQDIVVKNGGSFTRIKSTNGQVIVSFGDTNTITIDANQIHLSKGGDPDLTLDASGIRGTFSGSELNIHSGGADLTSGGHFCKVSSGGVALG